MIGHIFGLLTILVTQIGVIIADGTTPLAGKIAAVTGTAITVLFANVATQKRITTALVAVAGLGVPLLTFALTKMHAGTLAANIATVMVGVFVQLQRLYPVPVSRPTQGGHVRLPLLLLGLLLPTAIYLSASGCHNVKPDAFFNATVDCAKVNPEASAALASVETCLVGVISQNYAACLSGLVTEAHFTVDEIACVTAWIAQQNNAKVSLGTATVEDLQARQRAVDWLAQEKIAIRNSYSAGH